MGTPKKGTLNCGKPPNPNTENKSRRSCQESMQTEMSAILEFTKGLEATRFPGAKVKGFGG